MAVAEYCTYAATTRKQYFAHDAVEDKYGVIAPWYKGLNGQCDFRVRIAAETLKRYPWTEPNEIVDVPAYMVNGRWGIDQNGTIKVRPLDFGHKQMLSVIPYAKDHLPWHSGDYGCRTYLVLSGMVDYYRYTGDPAAIAHITIQANHMLDYTLTGDNHPWPNFPISVPVKGEGYHYYDPTSFIQLDIAAKQGLALLRAYQMVGENRWLEAAKHWGNLFAKNMKKNRQFNEAPWDRYATTCSSSPFWSKKLTGGTAFILEFLDELIRLGHKGKNNQIIEARDQCRAYIRDYLLVNWTLNDTWGRHYWDWEHTVQGILPTDGAARCLMANYDYFTNWQTDVRNILSIFLNHTSVNPDSEGDVYSGAWSYPESQCCCKNSLDYAAIYLAGVYAQYGVLADSEWAREMARRQIILATYHCNEKGVVKDLIDGGRYVAGAWFKIAHPAVLKYVLDVMAWMPGTFGASRENHIMRSSSVVNSVVYSEGRIEYSTFDAPSNTVDVLRLAFCPETITADDKNLKLRKELDSKGYTINKLSNGDCIITVRHDDYKSIVIQGNDPQKVTDDSNLQYKGKWVTRLNPNDFKDKIHVSSSVDSRMSYTFVGNQVRLIGRADPSGGLADVYLDGIKQLVGIDCWNPSKTRYQQVLYYKNGLPEGTHKLEVVVRGQKNPRSKDKEVYIDAVQSSDASGSTGFGLGGGPTDTQRMIFGYTEQSPYIDSKGNKWFPGTEFVVRLGKTDSVAKTWWTRKQTSRFWGTADPELYKYGVHAPDFTVNVTVGPGKYRIRLKFAETQYDQPNKRSMTIYINDEKVKENLDVFATAGRKPGWIWGWPVDMTFDDIEPENGIIEIRFEGEIIDSHQTEAMVQAIEVGPGLGGKGVVLPKVKE
ncbi:MAG: malectin domain-containing carbohydrate-binding protein [Planctomycetota bacterium]|jgi:hypothetical protein